MNRQVVKRDGRIQKFDIKKIKIVLFKISENKQVEFSNEDWQELAPRLQNRINYLKEGKIYIRDIDEVVIDSLLCSRFKQMGRYYIENRGHKLENRINDLNLSPISMELITSRYLNRDKENNIIETPKEMMNRVALCVSSIEKESEYYKEQFYKILTELRFLPNTPALALCGTDKEGCYPACFAYDVADSMDSIMDIAKAIAKTFKQGGGCGLNISYLRERGALINTTNGYSSGPVSFLLLYDSLTDVVKQANIRRGALMVSMIYTHPDIEEFINCKRDINILKNMNISILLDDKFFKKLESNGQISLYSPSTHKVIKKIDANFLFDKIAMNIWETGEPGLLFKDNMNEWNNTPGNPTPHLGELESTNVCSESNLYSHYKTIGDGGSEACVLGSINLVAHIEDSSMNWDKLEETVKLATRFLDNLIDLSGYPSEIVKKTVLRTRKIGVGIMGLADALILQGMKYSSKRGIKKAESIMSFINDIAVNESESLAKEKGAYETWNKDACINKKPRRNAIVTTVAPTGSLSQIASVSSGIEPNFAKSYRREFVTEGKIMTIKVQNADSEFFETSYDISPDKHLDMLVAISKHTENAVSKTINCPESTSVANIKDLIIRTHKLGIKGVALFRQNCFRKPLIKCDSEQCYL